jgi:FlgD Ig-like domain
VGIGDDPPAPFALRAWPNPARAGQNLRFTLTEPGRVDVAVFDASGRRVRALLASFFPEGVHEASWDGRDDAGNRVAPGLYFVRVRAGGPESALKLLRLP